MKVVKTIKLFIGGQFPRTESGRSFVMNKANSSEAFARLCLASRKDFRNAVEVAKKAQPSWAKRTAYNKGQILYRMAEMMEGKRDEFANVLIEGLGLKKERAHFDIDAAIDSFVYYAGFSDKYSQLIGAINPVQSSHHNFTVPEPVGVVAHFDNEVFSLEKLCSRLASIIVSGNSVVTLLSSQCPAILAPLSEVFATSDLPGGVINFLTGHRDELYKHIGSHREVRSIVLDEENHEFFHSLRELGVDNMKRVIGTRTEHNSLEAIKDCLEFKTAWHPIGV
jgi:acyl-CoA reductase-like NAD-dependent aldehyde dehydrogenase